MNCDKMGCNAYQRELHMKPGIPAIYICCRCNGCDRSCKAKGSNAPFPYDYEEDEDW